MRKSFRALNKIITVLVCISIVCSFLSNVAIMAEAESVAPLMMVEGYIPSRHIGREVSIDVFAEGMSPADIIEGVSMKDIIIYHGQATTTENGYYSFEFEVPDKYESYTAYIGTDESNEVEVRTLVMTDLLNLRLITGDVAGNIFTDDTSPCFSIEISNGLSCETSLILKSGVYKNADLISEKAQEINLEAYEKKIIEVVPDKPAYGFYEFIAELLPVGGEVCDVVQTRFSMVKKSESGQKNMRMGVVAQTDAMSAQDGALMALDSLGAGVVFADDYLFTAKAEINGDIDIVLSSAQTGHIYYDNANIEFNVSLKNNSAKEFSGKILWNIAGFSGEKSADVKLSAGESKEIPINVAVGKYGIFELQAEVVDELGNVIARTKPTRFSAVNAPSEGVFNKKLGTNLSIRSQNVHMGVPMINLQLASRIGLGFFRVEVAMGQYDQTHAEGITGLSKAHQELFRFLKKKGLTATMLLGYGQITDEDYIERMNTYAAALATDPLVNDVTHQYQLLNEPDLEFRNWSAERYVEVLKALYPVLTTADPQAFLWGPAAASMSSQNAWLSKFFELGGGDYVHGFDVHRYSLTSTPEEGAIEQFFDDYRGMMAASGNGHKPIYISEHGWSSTGENGYANEIQQAAYSVRTQFSNDYYNMWEQYASYCFNDGGTENEKEQRFGMVKARDSEIPYEAKPLYLAYANYNALMIGAEFKEKTDLSADIPVYRYKLADGRDAAVMWSIKGNNTVALELGTDIVEIYDMYGNKRTLYNNDGNYEVSLNEEPIYITGDFDKVKQTNAISKTFTQKLSELGITSDFIMPQNIENGDFVFVRSMLEKASEDEIVWTRFEERENGGLVKSRFSEIPYEATPLYAAVSAYNAILGKAAFKGKTVLQQGELYQFELNGKSVYALYGEGESCLVRLPVVQKMLVYDVYGNEQEISSQNGEFEIPLDKLAYFEPCEASIVVLKNGVTVNEETQFSAGDKVSIKVKPEKVDDNVNVIAVGYASGIMNMLNASSVTATDFTQEGAEVEISLPWQIDKFSVYIWNDAMAPVMVPFVSGGSDR